eukprot:2017264-Pyramimonas_sp.AAC.1
MGHPPSSWSLSSSPPPSSSSLFVAVSGVPVGRGRRSQFKIAPLRAAVAFLGIFEGFGLLVRLVRVCPTTTDITSAP